MGPAAATLPSPGPGTPGPRRCRPGTVAVLVAGVVGAGAYVLGRALRRVEVVGPSMAPTFLSGDRLVVRSHVVGRGRWPEVGAVVAVVDPRHADRVLVKRVARIDRAGGTLEVLGDDPARSTDSRTFGPLPLAAVVGRVVYRYAPAGRTGPGPWPREYHRP